VGSVPGRARVLTPAVNILCSYWMNIERDPAVRAAIDDHVAVLVRFDGDQPDPWANDQDFGLYFMLRDEAFASAGR